jgi:hypothetical protein
VGVVGERRDDPIDRAVYVDPKSAPAAWVLSRRDAALGRTERAQVPIVRARLARPSSVALQADDAALTMAAGRTASGRASWLLLAEAFPNDLRFRLPLARAHLASRLTDEASAVLDALPEWTRDDRAVIELRVAIADAAPDATASDVLLARWQAAAPDDPEPVRRRIALRVRERRYDAALELVDMLVLRGAADEARRLEIGLAIGVGDLARAEAAALTAGLPDVARRIAGRRLVFGDAAGAARAFDEPEPVVVLARAEALALADRGEEALAVVEEVLRLEPYQPEALALRVAILDDLGRPSGQARAALLAVDPDSPW